MTNALTGVANASLDNVPMVVVAGNVQSYFQGRHAHMETLLHADADQARAYGPWCKRIWHVERPEALIPALDAAFGLSQTEPCGPVLLDVAMDVFSAPVDLSTYRPRALPSAPGLSRELAETIADELLLADRLVLYAGEELGRTAAAEAAASFVALGEMLRAPMAYALGAKGAVPDRHPLCVGMSGFWGNPAANAACRDATVIFAVGAKFAELDASSWVQGTTFSIPPSRLIHTSVDPAELGRSYPTTIAAGVPASAVLSEVVRAVQAKTARRETVATPEAFVTSLAEQRALFEAGLDEPRRSDAVPLRPERILAEITSIMQEREDVILVGDTGWNKNGVGQQVPIDSLGRFIAPGGYATMGFGPAAALGVALAEPGKGVLALVGDGAFLANLSVVVSAVEEQIPVVWAVMDNGTYATISAMQERHFGSDYGSSFDSSAVNYVALAAATGAVGKRVEEAGLLRPALLEALDARRPAVVAIPCSRDNVPVTGIWEIHDLFERGVRRAT